MLRWSLAVTVVFCTAVVAALAGEQSTTWKAGEPAFTKSKDKKFHSSATIDNEKVTATLNNRGIILSTADYPDGAELSLTWEWKEGKDEGAYQDVLSVVVMTDGAQRPWSHEIRSGVAVQFSAPDSSIFVRRYISDEHSPKLLAKQTHVSFERNKKYGLRIAYDKTNLQVFMGDDREPLVSADLPPITNARIALYNREPVAGHLQLTQITNLFVNPKKAKK